MKFNIYLIVLCIAFSNNAFCASHNLDSINSIKSTLARLYTSTFDKSSNSLTKGISFSTIKEWDNAFQLVKQYIQTHNQAFLTEPPQPTVYIHGYIPDPVTSDLASITRAFNDVFYAVNQFSNGFNTTRPLMPQYEAKFLNKVISYVPSIKRVIAELENYEKYAQASIATSRTTQAQVQAITLLIQLATTLLNSITRIEQDKSQLEAARKDNGHNINMRTTVTKSLPSTPDYQHIRLINI
ncbi:hypothetical protein J120_04235 [candidate division TM6 bacterium JCVI TM6SC1]|uniref:Uncharacterized protein n=1 Tax=candidate division TM6 bacterium JCVI TM6SC1 TaxID=1306947 RepID=A0A0D2JL63_9BACT|nr:hypothetical protein J120_04235 [candidate division TM6 bacterium JCVI TM6SC1]